MFKYRTLLIAAFICLSGLKVLAQEETMGVDSPSDSKEEKKGELKSWYFGFNLGLAKVSYSSNKEINDFVQEARQNTSMDLPISVDLYFYWPMTDKFMLGVSDTGFSEQLSRDKKSSTTETPDKYTITIANLMVNGLYFFNSQNASEWFLRFGIGNGAAVGMATKDSSSSSPNMTSSVIKSGNGGVLGFGYNFPAGNRGALLNVSFNYMSENLSGGNVSSTSLSAGVMF